MTELVDPEVIESVVGMTRHDTIHFGRAVTTDERFYILHSRECRDDTADVRDCPFSLALDHGIMGVPGVDWATDTLLVLSIANDKLTTYQSWVLQDRGVFYPFVEDEDANITGLGHQDPETFAAAINRWDREVGGLDADELEDWTSSVGHRWARLDDDGERLHPSKPGDPGALAITTLWGHR